MRSKSLVLSIVKKGQVKQSISSFGGSRAVSEAAFMALAHLQMLPGLNCILGRGKLFSARENPGMAWMVMCKGYWCDWKLGQCSAPSLLSFVADPVVSSPTVLQHPHGAVFCNFSFSAGSSV